MKRVLKYVIHLLIAALAVPWLVIMAAGLGYGTFSPFLVSIRTPQQFYSDYLLILVVVVGGLLAYGVTDNLIAGPAVWVWIPFTIVFLVRVLYWRSEGSVFGGSGSFLEHFFTADCQIQNWREGGFGSRCPDKLFLTPLFIGSLSYSIGAAIHRLTQYWHRSKGASSLPVTAMPNPPQVVTTRLGAILALVVTASFVGRCLHSASAAQPAAWRWLCSGLFPSWAVATINIAFWGWVSWVGVKLAFANLRKDEKVLLASFVWTIMLDPVAAVLPRISGLVHVVQTLLSLAGFFAALVILLSFGNRDVTERA